MKIGFTTIYSWRPHVTQMYYLAQLARQAGHQAVFLACDGDLPTCNIRQMRPRRPSVVECAACRLGNIRTYDNESVSSIGALASSGPAAPAEAVDEWVASSASSLGRFETDADYESADFRRFKEALKPAAARTYAAARAWIGKEKLDGLFFFNGRMDTTRAVMEAANDAGIPFV
ncbi:MAG TPA: hypothetical protein VMV79_01985, partial [Alphaproteobacteria bacterium]|nr:hypothetical protein [Alphaproteobacteria bacterium]